MSLQRLFTAASLAPRTSPKYQQKQERMREKGREGEREGRESHGEKKESEGLKVNIGLAKKFAWVFPKHLRKT